MVSAYNTPWVIRAKYVLSNYFTTLGLLYARDSGNDGERFVRWGAQGKIPQAESGGEYVAFDRQKY